MQVQVNTSNGIDNKESLERFASDYLNEHLGRFNQDITRIEVQLYDENHGAKGGPDIRCMLEARINGREPVAVHNDAVSQDLAFRGAADKLARALDHALGKLDRANHRARDTIRKDADQLVDTEQLVK
jgi:ribosome-associated translation inhibitor RaiA